MFTKPAISQVKAINSISRKFEFTQSQLTFYYKGLKAGRPENTLIAELFEAPDGVDPLQHLNSILEPTELTTLKQRLQEMAPRSVRKK